MALSEDDLRGLSANEREALLEAEADDPDGDIAHELGHTATAPAAAPAAPAPKTEETETDEEDDAAAAAAAAAAPKPADALAAGDTPADGAAATEDDEDDLPAAPVRAAPDDIDKQRTDLNAREDESMQKLLDGEITQEDHAKIKNEVRQKLDALLVAEATDRAADAIDRRAMMSSYNADLKATVKLGKAAGLDYAGDELGPQFDRVLKMFSRDFADQGVYDAPGNLANSKAALAEAHAYMLRRAGKAAPATAAAPAPAAAPAAPKPGRPAPDRSQLGITLAGVPTAADPRITSEFAHLDGISEPAALERELAKLTPEQQERYLGA